MITNVWSNISFYCNNGHEEPVKFVKREGESPFYACPRYMRRDEKHPDGHEMDEPACPNRVSFNDAASIVEKFAAVVEESILSGEITDFSNFKFNYKMYQVTILSYDDDEVQIGIINRRAIEQ